MAQHLDPSFRPGRGKTQDVIWLNKEGQTAHSLWFAILTDRYCQAHPRLHPDHQSRVHYDRLDATLSKHRGTLLGELLHTAVMDAQSRTIPDPQAPHGSPGSLSRAEWEMAKFFADEQIRLDPPPALVTDESTYCRHGKSYAGDCADCDEDFS